LNQRLELMARSARRKGKTPAQEWTSFLFKIERLHSHYSFGRGHRLTRTAFAEYLHPKIEATCLAPNKFKGRLTEFTLIGDRLLEQDLWMQTRAPEHEGIIGTLTMRGEQSSYLGSLPYDAAWRLSPVILVGGFRYIYLHGSAMYRGTAQIRTIGFYEEFDVEDA
jgi:hypothetical protein